MKRVTHGLGQEILKRSLEHLVTQEENHGTLKVLSRVSGTDLNVLTDTSDSVAMTESY